jgi:hypothetical protein
MFRDIPVHDAPRAQIEDHEDVHEAKRRGHHDEEIARQYGARVIPDKNSRSQPQHERRVAIRRDGQAAGVGLFALAVLRPE